jgi:hypothetical protein
VDHGGGGNLMETPCLPTSSKPLVYLSRVTDTPWSWERINSSARPIWTDHAFRGRLTLHAWRDGSKAKLCTVLTSRLDMSFTPALRLKGRTDPSIRLVHPEVALCRWFGQGWTKRICGAEIFDDRQVQAVHALVDAARDISRGKRRTIELPAAAR